MEKGTLVMICSGNVGLPAILEVKASVHDGFLAFPEIYSNANTEFLYYIFNSLLSKFNSSATHGGIFTNLTTNIIKNFSLALPPVLEQQKIAFILSTVDEKLENLHNKKGQYEQLKKGLMQKLLTGKIRVKVN